MRVTAKRYGGEAATGDTFVFQNNQGR